MKIEEALKELEEIANKLEDDKTTLDESLELFDAGVALAEKCAKILSEGRGRLTLLKKKLDEISEEEFELEN